MEDSFSMKKTMVALWPRGEDEGYSDASHSRVRLRKPARFWHFASMHPHTGVDWWSRTSMFDHIHLSLCIFPKCSCSQCQSHLGTCCVRQSSRDRWSTQQTLVRKLNFRDDRLLWGREGDTCYEDYLETHGGTLANMVGFPGEDNSCWLSRSGQEGVRS